MRCSFRPLAILSLTFLLLLPSADAWALQPHSGPEGRYVHQMAHILFMGALTYLFFHTGRTQDVVSRGWRYLRLFCILLFFWNLMAFVGHETAVHLSHDDFIDEGTWSEQLVFPLNFLKLLYFVAKMDHFLTVPALLALSFSLRSFYREARGDAAK